MVMLVYQRVFTHSLTPSFLHSLMVQLVQKHPFIQSLDHPVIHPFIRSLIRSFIHGTAGHYWNVYMYMYIEL